MAAAATCLMMHACQTKTDEACLVGGGLDDADGERDDECESEGEEHPPPRQLHLLLPDEGHEQREHQEPPLRHLLVPLHQLRVHVLLHRVHRRPALLPHVTGMKHKKTLLDESQHEIN
jgi:hypothetical protein